VRGIVVISRAFPLCRDSAALIYSAGMYPLVIPMMRVSRVDGVDYQEILSANNIIITSRNIINILNNEIIGGRLSHALLYSKIIYVVGRRSSIDLAKVLGRYPDHYFSTASEMKDFIVSRGKFDDTYIHLTSDRRVFDIYELKNAGFKFLHRSEIYKVEYVEEYDVIVHILNKYINIRNRTKSILNCSMERATEISFMIYSREMSLAYGKLLRHYDISKVNFIHISDRVYNSFEFKDVGRHRIAKSPSERSMISAILGISGC
jgi:hypothetical protein